jgi:hypothetical protein
MRFITSILVLAAVIALFLTTPAGKRIAARLGIRVRGKESAPREDHEYLLRVCGGDYDRLRAMLDEARRHNPDMSEAQAYRRAIRTHLRDEN